MLAYSRMGRTSVVYARCLVLRGHVRLGLGLGPTGSWLGPNPTQVP